MDSIRWAILGAGRFGTIHARALQGMVGVELVALCTRNPRQLERVTHDFPGVETEIDAAALLAREEIDAVTIATHWKRSPQVGSTGTGRRQACTLGEADGSFR